MPVWKDIPITFKPDGTPDFQNFGIELNRRIKYYLDNIDIAQILFNLNDVGGTLILSKGGTGSQLAAPAGDRIMFYDTSESKVDWLTAGSGLAISGTTISASLAAVILGTSNQITVTDNGNGTYTLSTPQNIDTSADVEFDSIKLDDLTASRLTASDANKKIVSVSDLTAWIAGTTNRITVTSDGDGTITLSAPQDLHTGADVTFDDITGTGKVKGATGHFGGSTNYAEFEADGTLVFRGNATVWEDENFDGLAATIGVSAPDLINLDTTSIKIPALNGVGVTVEELNASREYPHRGKIGSDMLWHVHWMSTTTDLGNIKLFIEIYIKRGSTIVYNNTISATDSTTGTAWECKRLSIGTLSGTGIQFGDQIHARLYRDPADAADTYGFDIAISTFGYHYEIDTFGTRTISSK